MKKSLPWFVCSLIVFTMGCSKEELLPSEDYSFGGVWSTGCLQTSAGGSLSSKVTLQTTAYKVEYNYFLDATCSAKVQSLTESGTYSFEILHNDVLGQRGTVDWNFQKAEMTSFSSSAITNMNNNNYCGINTWTYGVAQDLTGKICDSQPIPSANTIQYDIFDITAIDEPYYGIEPGDLTFGHFNATYDGTTPAKRPTSTSGNIVYKKQQ